MNRVLTFLIFIQLASFTQAQDLPIDEFDKIIVDIEDSIKHALKMVKEADKRAKNAPSISKIAKHIVAINKEIKILQSQKKNLEENKKKLNQEVNRLKKQANRPCPSPTSQFSTQITQNFEIPSQETPKYQIITSIQRLQNYSVVPEKNIAKINTEIDYLKNKGIYWSSENKRVVIEYVERVTWDKKERQFIKNLLANIRQIPRDYNEVHYAYLELLKSKRMILELYKLRNQYTKPIQRQYIDDRISEINRE